MSGFTVSPESFAPVAAQLRAAAEDVATAWTPVRGASQQVHCGSTDQVSPLIQVSLQAAVSLVDSCLSSAATALHGYADGLEQMGRSYDSAEAETSALFRAG